jgi:hypothetical protein
MSWSLQLRGGDLVIGGSAFGTITGQQKLVQDLRCAILERMGTDEDHPWFGSLIDGGRLNGVDQPSIIATDDWDVAVLAVEGEIRRIVDQYQKQQIVRTERDRTNYGKPTLVPGEVLMGVGNIQFYQAQDNLLCRVTLITGADSELTLNVPLGTNTLI